jgi:hypothetical protein
MNFFSAKSPPAAKIDLASRIDSPSDRLSSTSMARFPGMIISSTAFEASACYAESTPREF